MGRPQTDLSKFRKETLLTLLLLDNGSFGRYALSTYLGLTKAKTRTLLEQLNELDLAHSNKGRGGTQLTHSGRELIRKIREYCYLDWNHETVKLPDDFLTNGDEMGILYFKNDGFSSNGLYERDIAVRQGALGAITLKQNNKNDWVFPNDDTTAKRIAILDHELIDNYNVMIISFGDNLGGVFSALSAVLLYHLQDELEDLLP